jgi:hypothetical protein
MRRLLKNAVVTATLAVAVAIAVNACAPTQIVSEPYQGAQPLVAEPHSESAPEMELVRLGGD